MFGRFTSYQHRSARALLAPVTANARPRLANLPGPGRPGPFSFLAGAVLASLADFLADGQAPSWLVRVGTCLVLHFPGCNLRLCLDRLGLLLWELGRRLGLLLWKLGRYLFAILPGPAAEETHSAAEKTHGVSIGRRLADFLPL